jgi:two-component system response regulator DevR
VLGSPGVQHSQEVEAANMRPERHGSRLPRGEPGAAAPVRLVAADPERVVHEGLRAVLRRTQGLRLEATAYSGAEAVHLVRLLRPHVAVVEVSFPSPPGGVKLVEELCRAHPGVGILVFSAPSAEGLLVRLLAAGARGFVPKEARAEILVHAIRTVASGGWYVEAGPKSTLFETLRSLARSGPLDAPVPNLTARQREFLRLLVEGLTDAQIARALHLATPTVKAQLRVLYRHLGARNRAHAVARAVLWGLLD